MIYYYLGNMRLQFFFGNPNLCAAFFAVDEAKTAFPESGKAVCVNDFAKAVTGRDNGS